jgi:hypothetical protein
MQQQIVKSTGIVCLAFGKRNPGIFVKKLLQIMGLYANQNKKLDREPKKMKCGL